MWHVTRDMWHVTCDMLWGVNIFSKFQLPSSYCLWFMILWRYGGKADGWINELINHEAPWIVPRVSGHPHSAQESFKWKACTGGAERQRIFFLSSSCLCLMGWGSSSLEILQVCSWADQGSSQLGIPVAKRRCRGFLEVYRVEAVYRTAPATPGLLIKGTHTLSFFLRGLN